MPKIADCLADDAVWSEPVSVAVKRQPVDTHTAVDKRWLTAAVDGAVVDSGFRK
jgi:hypothetical protein